MRSLRAYLAVPAIFRGAALLLLSAATLIFVQIQMRAPMQQESLIAEARYNGLKAQVSQLSARIDSIETYDDMQRQLASVAKRFEANVDRSGVVERLTNLSAQAGTRIIHGASSFGRPRGEIVPVEQDLTIEGSYVALARFFSGLETLETLTLLRSSEFAANPDGTLVRAKIKLVTLNAESAG